MNITFAKQYLDYMNSDSEVLKQIKELMSGNEVKNPIIVFNDEVQEKVYNFFLERSIKDKDSYEVHIETWENDGDDYSTQVITVCSETDLNQLLYVLEMFAATSEDLGNEDYNASTFASSLVCGIDSGKLTREFIKEFFCIDVPEYTDIGELEEWADDFEDSDFRTLDCIHELLGSPVSYDYEFCRIVESVKVKNAITYDIVAKFDGANYNNPEINWTM